MAASTKQELSAEQVAADMRLAREIGSVDDPRVPELVDRMANYIGEVLPAEGWFQFGEGGAWYHERTYVGHSVIVRDGSVVESAASEQVIEAFLNDVREGLVLSLASRYPVLSPEIKAGVAQGTYPPW